MLLAGAIFGPALMRAPLGPLIHPGEAKATEVWRQVDDLIVKIMVAVEPNMMEGIRQHIPAVAAGAPNKQCFQVRAVGCRAKL